MRPGITIICTARLAMLLACTSLSALGQEPETGPLPNGGWSQPPQPEMLPRAEEASPAPDRPVARPGPSGSGEEMPNARFWPGLDHRGKVTQQAPPQSWIHWWCPRPNMLQRHAYPESHGYYSFRPYTVSHIQMQQEFVREIGGDPRAPYSIEIFERLQPQSAADREPIRSARNRTSLQLGPASGTRTATHRR